MCMSMCASVHLCTVHVHVHAVIDYAGTLDYRRLAVGATRSVLAVGDRA